MTAITSKLVPARLRTVLAGLERRDRLALTALALFTALMVLYFGLWAPAAAYLDAVRTDREANETLLVYMRSTEANARQSGDGRASGPGGQALLTQVSRTAQLAGVKPNRLQPEGSDSVSVFFDDVVFNDLIRWLDDLESKHGIGIRRITLDRQEATGRVNATVVLRS